MFTVPERRNVNTQDAFEADTTFLGVEGPVFNETASNESLPTITVQPYANDEYPGTRRPIPISTIDWQSTHDNQIIAGNGIEFLRGVDQLYVQQTIELSDLMSNVESENRYVVKVPMGESIYYASETSTQKQRMVCGSNRAFTMRLYDQTQQEALILKRRIACGFCSIWCYLQFLEVWMPRDQYVGKIKQNFSLTVPSFSVYNNHGSIIYRIEGPPTCGCSTASKEAHFKIYSGDGLTQLGSINHHWDQVHSSYNLCLQFPSRRDDCKNKALLLGAAFLLEYMYFVNAKKSGCC